MLHILFLVTWKCSFLFKIFVMNPLSALPRSKLFILRPAKVHSGSKILTEKYSRHRSACRASTFIALESKLTSFDTQLSCHQQPLPLNVQHEIFRSEWLQHSGTPPSLCGECNIGDRNIDAINSDTNNGNIHNSSTFIAGNALMQLLSFSEFFLPVTWW